MYSLYHKLYLFKLITYIKIICIFELTYKILNIHIFDKVY